MTDSLYGRALSENHNVAELHIAVECSTTVFLLQFNQCLLYFRLFKSPTLFHSLFLPFPPLYLSIYLVHAVMCSDQRIKACLALNFGTVRADSFHLRGYRRRKSLIMYICIYVCTYVSTCHMPTICRSIRVNPKAKVIPVLELGLPQCRCVVGSQF